MADLEFFKAACQQYRTVGTFLPSTKWASRRIGEALREGAGFVVELGAGSGSVTRALLDRLPLSARLVAVEITPSLIPPLQRIHDSRLTIVEGDARRLIAEPQRLGLPRVDAIVSGIPLSFLDTDERDQFIARAAQCVRPAGQFITYQVTPLSFGLLKKHFPQVDVSFDARNFPPYFIASAR